MLCTWSGLPHEVLTQTCEGWQSTLASAVRARTCKTNPRQPTTTGENSPTLAETAQQHTHTLPTTAAQWRRFCKCRPTVAYIEPLFRLHHCYDCRPIAIRSVRAWQCHVCQLGSSLDAIIQQALADHLHGLHDTTHGECHLPDAAPHSASMPTCTAQVVGRGFKAIEKPCTRHTCAGHLLRCKHWRPTCLVGSGAMLVAKQHTHGNALCVESLMPYVLRALCQHCLSTHMQPHTRHLWLTSGPAHM